MEGSRSTTDGRVLLMGNFDAHFTAGKRYALCVVAIGGFIAFQWGFSMTQIGLTALVAGAYGLLASLLPDIDHQDSKPRQAAGKYVSLGIIGAIILLPVAAPDLIDGLGRAVSMIGVSGAQDVLGSGVVLISGVGLLIFGGDLFDQSLTHRGFTHSFPFAFFVGIAAYFSLALMGRVISQLQFLAGEVGVIVAL